MSVRVYEGLKKAIYLRDYYSCRYCGKNLFTSDRKILVGDISLDHVVPSSRGGLNSVKNLVTSCRSCNSKKHIKLLNECDMALLPTDRTVIKHERVWRVFKCSSVGGANND
jgi:5-methylcytosine-specific restriction endonuclease McrA